MSTAGPTRIASERARSERRLTLNSCADVQPTDTVAPRKPAASGLSPPSSWPNSGMKVSVITPVQYTATVR